MPTNFDLTCTINIAQLNTPQAKPAHKLLFKIRNYYEVFKYRSQMAKSKLELMQTAMNHTHIILVSKYIINHHHYNATKKTNTYYQCCCFSSY
jgi:hypothetical protein